MSRKAVVIIVFFLIVLILGGYKYISSQKAVISGLKVVSQPASSIYLNDKLVGKTPLEVKYNAGDYILKLIPDDPTAQASAWQGKVTLNPQVLTYVNKELGISELKTGGEILTLEKISQSEAQLFISVQPEGATVLMDGQEKGVSPLLLREVVAGEHDVAVSSPGFIERTVKVQATTGYKLNVNFQLALSESLEATSSATVTPAPTEKVSAGPAKPYVEIKDTPTGFLRVRSGPSLSASETAQLKPGEKYPFLEEKEGWFKISINDKEGWISARYANKVE